MNFFRRKNRTARTLRPIHPGKKPTKQPNITYSIEESKSKSPMPTPMSVPDSWRPYEYTSPVADEASPAEKTHTKTANTVRSRRTLRASVASPTPSCKFNVTKKQCKGRLFVLGNSEASAMLYPYLYDKGTWLNLNADHTPVLPKNITCKKLQKFVQEFMNFADCDVVKRIQKITLRGYKVSAEQMAIVPFMFQQLPHLKEMHVDAHYKPEEIAKHMSVWKSEWGGLRVNLKGYFLYVSRE